MSNCIINGITIIELNPEKKEEALKRGYAMMLKIKREKGLLNERIGKD